MTIGILCSDLTIRTVYDEFRTMITSYRASEIDGFALCAGAFDGMLSMIGFNLPATSWMRHHMDVFCHKWILLSRLEFEP